MNIEKSLDHILAVQISIAWAGESGGEPARLGWWASDLVDEVAGGDLFRRLAPHTHRWAALQAVREVARRADAAARKSTADPDQIISLFHLGFELDEQLDERLAWHKREETTPEEVLPDLFPITDALDRGQLEKWLESLKCADHQVQPVGRLVKGEPPADLQSRIDQLAATLLPLADRYPLPHYKVAP